MYEHILLNLSLLAIFTFVGMQLRYHPYVKNISSNIVNLLIGLYMGLTGSVLYEFNIVETSGYVMSFRSIALLIAIHSGGLVSGVITLIAISIPVMGDMDLWLSSMLMLALIGGVAFAIIRKRDSFPSRWLFMSVSTVLIMIMYGIVRSPGMIQNRATIPYLISVGLGILFIGFFIRYLCHTSEVQEQLRETKDELTNTMMMHNGITFKIIKQDGQYVYKMISGKLLSRFAEALNVEESELVPGLRVSSLLPSSSAASFRGHIEAVWNKGVTSAYESRVGTLDLWISLLPISEDGTTTSIIGTMIDRSEQKEAERRIHESEERYLTLAENPQDFILELDHDGIVLFANSYFCNMARKDQSEVVSRPLFELGMKMNEPQWRKHWTEIAATGRKTRFEATIVTTDGKSREYYVILSDIQGFSEDEGYMICSMHEITELKQADQESRAKSRFLARVSHEIRTPLNGIIGLAQLMKHTELSDIQQDYLHKIRSSSDLLLGIINDILDLSKIEAGKLKMERIDFEMDELIFELTNTFAVLKGIKQIEVIVETDANLPAQLRGDPLRLKQILMNLCSNAIKFTEQGHVHLYVQQMQRKPHSAIIRFTVEDTGIGMTDEQLSMLHEPFWQAEYESGDNQTGTGLGLPIVKDLVTLLGGELRVMSRIGIGSRFQFEIEMPVSKPDQRSWAVFSQDRCCRIHFVEDDPLNRDVIARTLESFNCQVTTTQSWEHLYHFLERTSHVSDIIDCIVVDMEMDDMYGEHTWSRIMELCRRNGIAVIALASAYAREEIMQMMDGQLPDALLSKPTSRLELYQTLRRITLNAGTSAIGLGDASRQAAPAAVHEQAVEQASILLVEDNEINQQVAVELLRLSGFEVTVACHGLEALDRLQEQSFDLILMDMYMPILNGYETTKRIRASADYSHIPIIALTANAMQSDHQAYYEIGINDILLKPLDAELLRKCVGVWLSSSREQQLSRQPEELALYEEIRESILGIELDQMLKRLEGKVSIVLHILNLFKKEYTGFTERIARLLDNGDFKAAAREAHTLIGVAKNMSAYQLTVAAIQLESVIIDNPIAYDDALKNAAAEIDAIIRSFPQQSSLKMKMKDR